MSFGLYDPAIILDKSPGDKRRIRNLEERLLEQEKTSRALVEKAFEFREHLTERNLETSTMDAALQKLWHEHIRTITSSVRHLNREIDGLKDEIRSRDSITQSVNYQTLNVEQQVQTGVSDLRGRVVRCDTSIAQLAYDLRAMANNSQVEGEKLRRLEGASKSKTSQIDEQIVSLTKRLDHLITEQEGKIQQVKGNNEMQVEAVDSRIKAILEDMRLVMESNKKYAETERLRIEQQMMQLIELNSSIIQTKQDAFESKILERMDTLQRAVDECKDECKATRAELKRRELLDDPSIQIEQLNMKMDGELSRLKQEYREGFASVKESITATNSLVNGKVKLVKEELTKDINNVKKMVVLI